ncbi:hypothetical protein V144x_04800 [Gimesia aquarii]|uniref:Uncharacterized protein n=1 Tax=Gimesia aquarii TaxID=2527964 RepID=A0A517VPW0_9PLAN|nr:hypothetical protein V144x_04800 [Gimesia aquarii]
MSHRPRIPTLFPDIELLILLLPTIGIDMAIVRHTMVTQIAMHETILIIPVQAITALGLDDITTVIVPTRQSPAIVITGPLTTVSTVTPDIRILVTTHFIPGGHATPGIRILRVTVHHMDIPVRMHLIGALILRYGEVTDLTGEATLEVTTDPIVASGLIDQPCTAA